MRTARADIAVAPVASDRTEIIERAIFWTFAAGLAWTPFWYGSNDLIAWGINAIVFPGLALAYEVSLLIRGRRHPIGIRQLQIAVALFAAVVFWTWFQTATWAPSALAHPIWGMASASLEKPVAASISVNRDLTTLALVRLITAASAFWLAAQLCRKAARADLLIKAIVAICCAYSAHGLIAFAIKSGHMPWLERPSTTAFVSSTFVNQNSFAAYAGIGLIAICGILLRLYRHHAAVIAGPRRLWIVSLIETTGSYGVTLLAGGFLILVALLLTGSRGGVIATALGLFVLGLLTLARGTRRSAGQLVVIVCGAVLVATICVGFGDALVANMAKKGLGDTSRMAVYLITLWSILDAPVLGHGYGTFIDVFPIYRDHSIGSIGVWEQAHNTYLEIFQGLGLVFGSMLLGSILLLVLSCLRGALTRQENSMIPCVAASVAVAVGFQAMVDFALQIQAVALAFMAVLGAGVAQSASSRRTLED